MKIKRLIFSLLATLLLAVPVQSAQYYGRLNGWDIRSSCTAYVSTGVGCYDSVLKTFCIGNGTSCVIQGGASFISDTAYDATSWDGVTTIAPSKNAVRDKFESLTQANIAGLTTTSSPTFKIATLTDLTPTYIPLAGTGGLLGNSIVTQPSTSSVNIGGTGIIKGPAIITTFAGTVSTSGSSTTITFTSAADAILAGYHATSPALGTTLITTAVNQASVTRYIVSWTNATACVVDSACTLAASSTLASVQLPITTFVNSAGVVTGWMNAAGLIYLTNGLNIGTTAAFGKFNITGPPEGTVSIDRAGGGLGRLQLFVGDGTASSGYTYTTDEAYFAGNNTDFHFVSMSGNNEVFKITTTGTSSVNGNILIGGIAAAGTSAAKVLGMGQGTAPTSSPADASQMWVQNYNAVAGDARFSFMGEASAAKRAVLGSGTVSIKGAATSGGGLTRQLAEAVSAALSGATGSIAVNVPSGARILGVQLRVDTAITSDNATKTWAADYVNTPTTAITTGQVFDANTKFNAIHPAYEITTDTVTITITAAAGLFTAGVVRAIVYYEAIDAMSSL